MGGEGVTHTPKHTPKHARKLDRECTADCVACKLGIPNTLDAEIERRWATWSDDATTDLPAFAEFSRHIKEVLKEFG